MAKDDKKQNKRLPGFYIALCCCVLVIGAAGYFTERGTANKSAENTEEFGENTFAASALNRDDTEPDGEIISVGEVTTAADDTAETPSPEPPAETEAPEQPAPAAAAEPEYAKDNPDVMETAVNIEAEDVYFSFPAGGEVLAAYSEELTFNEALGDYRTHNGIDIAADEGCSISSAADGTVDDISEDAYGICISIAHDGGFISKYMCLGAAENIKAGDAIKRGDVIGTVGASRGENTKEPHLHFELYKDGAAVDPEKFLN